MQFFGAVDYSSFWHVHNRIKAFLRSSSMSSIAFIISFILSFFTFPILNTLHDLLRSYISTAGLFHPFWLHNSPSFCSIQQYALYNRVANIIFPFSWDLLSTKLSWTFLQPLWIDHVYIYFLVNLCVLDKYKVQGTKSNHNFRFHSVIYNKIRFVSSYT